ncbi:hypothetical protein CAEBREN_03180 [Caenorhabditis brenneri]|uniref:Uncharacterized protein n=1 Tax=Caenorhabditis brenneri TaxID=135651 RepID=G0NAF4_CAEBE|nr:hypothetical protein CAEBREN_03180 [Caenorhabditis brenneri]
MPEFPEKPEEVLHFWQLMLKALKKIGARKVELWELEGIVALALELDTIDRWTLNGTFDEFPRLGAHLALVPLSVGKILYLQRRLMIALHPDDKAKLEAKNDIVIKTSNSNYVISWKENEQEKKTGEAGKKEEEKKEKRDGEGKVEEAKEQKVADTKDTKDTKEPKMDDEASDGKNKVEGDDDKTGEEEEMNEKKNGEGVKKKEKKVEKKSDKKEKDNGKNPDEMKRGRFTKDEEDRMMCYVVETIKKNSSYGLKSNKMSTGDAWSEFSTREEKRNPEKKKSPGSYETHFHKQLKPKFFSFECLSPEDRLLIGKPMEAKMTSGSYLPVTSERNTRFKSNSRMSKSLVGNFKGHQPTEEFQPTDKN